MKTKKDIPIAIGGGIAVAAVVGAFLYFGGIFGGSAAGWHNPTYSAVNYTVARNEDLTIASDKHQVKPIAVALFNDKDLGAEFPRNCGNGVAFYREYPRHPYFCNNRVNLARANTLVRGQQIRIPVANNVPKDIAAAVEFTKGELPDSIAIVVDGGSSNRQKNLDAAVQFMLALNQQGQTPAAVWIYDDVGMHEYRNEAALLPFATGLGGTDGALRVLSATPARKIVLITDRAAVALPETLKIVRQPVIGYCTAEPCVDSMRTIAKETNGRIV